MEDMLIRTVDTDIMREKKWIGFVEAAGEERGRQVATKKGERGVLLTSTTRKRRSGHPSILSFLHTNAMSHGMAHKSIGLTLSFMYLMVPCVMNGWIHGVCVVSLFLLFKSDGAEFFFSMYIKIQRERG